MAEFAAVIARYKLVAPVLAVAALGLALSGCLKDQRRLAQACALHAESNGQIEACMTQAGYLPVFRRGRCRRLFAPARDPLCYRPRAVAERIAVVAQLALERVDAGLQRWLTP
ncbi:MAG: hypothetical protein ISS15_05730 [Alphaproteobacteria bacterium]|nr:hypothetical protein [Alphaproteobacteria bacterium]MBL7097140.1 hypothetical protein [Alphaproteobacteria bacterium]